MQRLLKSFSGLPDRQAPAFRGADLRERVQLPLPKHLAPEIERGKKTQNETVQKVLRVLDGEEPTKEVV